MRHYLWVVRRLAVLVVLIAGACSGSHPGKAVPPVPRAPGGTSATTATASTAPAAGTAVSAAQPCTGGRVPASYQHVVWIVMENHGLEDVDGARSAPFVNGLGRRCGLATRYSGVSHPSLPNYLALTSGSTHGVSDDAGPSSHPIAGPSIFSLLGADWSSPQESMPAPCDRASGGGYATKHNPAVYYSGIADLCRTRDVPMDDAAPDVSRRFTFITPNLCNDGHDCSLATADHWLAVEVPRILDSAEYRSGTSALFITWDENDSGGSLVPTYVVAASVPPGTRDASPFNHYSLLRTTEELLGLNPLLGAAATAPSMRGAFHL